MGLFDILKKPEQSDKAQAPETKPKVLVVDDEHILKKYYEDLFSKHGYQVMTAYNGKEALDLMEQTMPDVIVLDIIMPTMDGFEFLKQLHRDEQKKGIPVIMLTNVGTIQNMEKAKSQYGVFQFLIKVNVTADDIIRAVSDAVRESKRGVLQPVPDGTANNEDRSNLQ